MSAEVIAVKSWPHRRWWGMVASVLCVQLGLIYWLSDRHPVAARTLQPAPALRIAETNSELVALTDPTLFALPHRQGFSGPAWLEFRAQDSPTNSWTSEPGWLTLSAQRLGTEFGQWVDTNRSAPWTAPGMPEAELTLPQIAPPTLYPDKSELHIAGDLAGRKLLTMIELPSFSNNEPLTSSVVQMVVDADGRCFSAVLLPPGSGSREADQYALSRARAARFEPISGSPDAHDPLKSLRWGQFIFDWHTLPPTNAP